MMLEEAVIELCEKTINQCNDWYRWYPIDEAQLPARISLPEGNEYTKNVALKLALNKEWLVGDAERKIEIIKFYISTWGGINNNSQTNIKQYSNSHPDNLISSGIKGIASWSKALCVYDPYEYAIFDARVSASLNALQMLRCHPNPKIFPILPSRNPEIKQANERFSALVYQGWSVIDDHDCYKLYLNLLKETRSKLNMLNVEIFTIEMLLFSKAEELVRKAFPKNISEVAPIVSDVAITSNDVIAHSNKANKNPMDRPSFRGEKTGPCPKCGYSKVVARQSGKTKELYFGCDRPKQSANMGCNFKGCRSH